MNWSVINSGIRYGATAAAAALATATTIGLLSSADSNQLVAAVNQIGTGLVSVITGVSVIVGFVGPIIGMLRSTHKAAIAIVNNEVPGVKVVADSAPVATVTVPPATKGI